MKVLAFFKENKDKIILGVIVLWLLSIIFSIFYLISYIVTSYGSFLLFFISLGFLVHFCTRVATFPGAYCLWRRTMEKSALQTIATSTYKKLEILNAILLAIQDNDFQSIYDRVSLSTIQSIPKHFERIMRNLEYVRTMKINEEQLETLNLFNNLHHSLQSIKVTSKSCDFNLYGFLSSPKVYRNVSTESNEEVQVALNLVNSLYGMIRKSIKEPESFKELVGSLNIRKSPLFGSLSYMRNDIIDKLKAEQIWITSFDGCKIDCLWVPGSSSTTVLYCNPNGGLYEFTCLQNEWVDYYLDLGFNVMLWNYRGYGRSQGIPDMPSIATDGEKVFEYIKDVKNSEKIAVHGQSLGGSVAARLAKCADFVFADRTFRGLSDVALFSYGKVIYHIYKLLGPSETDPAKEFIASNNYKVIGCDCEDAMIPHISSLKAGVVFALRHQCEISGTNVYSLMNSYRSEKAFNNLITSLSQNKFLRTCRDEESPEIDVVGALCNLEVQGRNLYKISKKSEMELELILWIDMAYVWPENRKTILTAVGDIEKLLDDTSDNIQAKYLKGICKSLREIFNEIFEGEENNENPGFILNLNCGHNATFTPYELYYYKLHLKSAGLIK